MAEEQEIPQGGVEGGAGENVGSPVPGGLPPPAGQPGSSDWREMLPPEYREHGYIKAHDSLESFLRQADHAIRIQGRSVVLPESTDDPEYNVKYLSALRRLGAPESPEGYQMEIPEGLPLNPTSLD